MSIFYCFSDILSGWDLNISANIMREMITTTKRSKARISNYLFTNAQTFSRLKNIPQENVNSYEQILQSTLLEIYKHTSKLQAKVVKSEVTAYITYTHYLKDAHILKVDHQSAACTYLHIHTVTYARTSWLDIEHTSSVQLLHTKCAYDTSSWTNHTWCT